MFPPNNEDMFYTRLRLERRYTPIRANLPYGVMADLPSGEFDRFENWASETSKIIAPLRRLRPDEVADACQRLYPEKLERHIDWAKQIAKWYAAYAEELESKKSQGSRVVK
jgi:hypothetical protein